MKIWILLLSFIFPQLGFSIEPKTAFIDLAKKVSPSVVNISTTKEGVENVVQIFPGYFVPFNVPQMTASGSGFIVDKTGLIVTNSHVVQNFDKIQVQFAGDENFYPAKVLGSDNLSDIALLKVHTKKKLVPFKFGDSEELQVGEWVAAIGNPHGYGHTMTKGIISAVKREIDDLNLFPLLQTDASINPGNSGGPLVNLKGEVIGVNQAIVRGAMGIGFAIPINNVKEVLKDLKTFGFVRRGFIGVEFLSRSQQKGAVITNVIPGSPAEKAGLKIKDQIIEFAGYKIKSPRELPKAVQKVSVGKKVSLKIIRNGKQAQLSITPKLLQKDNLSSFQVPASQKRSKIRGQLISGGFKVAEISTEILKHFNQPDLGAKNPIVVYVKQNSPAFKGGLRPGDLVFQINGKKISRVSQVRTSITKGLNQLSILRYHHRYDKYLLLSINLKI